jgi:hypothetical protein
MIAIGKEVIKVLNRRVLLPFLLLGASAPIAAQVPWEYDVEPIDGGGPIYLPSIQLNNASSAFCYLRHVA